MPPRDPAEIRRIEFLASELIRGRSASPEKQHHNERVAKGLQVTGDLIRWMRTGERPGDRVPIAQRAKVSRLVEDIGLIRPTEPARTARQR